MAKLKVFAVIGGISSTSLNQKLYRAAEALKPADVELYTFDISQLPFFNQDLEKNVPIIVSEFRQAIRFADAILFVTPEYNHTVPGILTNAIAWGSRPSGQSAWNKKPAGIIGASAGQFGTYGAQRDLRHVLAYLNMPTVGQPEFYCNGSKAFDEQGHLIDEKTKNFLEAYWEAFVTFSRPAVPKLGTFEPTQSL